MNAFPSGLRPDAGLRAVTGLAATVVTFGSIGLAVLFAKDFALTGNALSNVGVTATDVGTPLTAALFNGGLLTGGLLGVVFAGTLFHGASTPGRRLVGPVFAAAMVCLALIGVYPQDTDPHVPVALGFYLLSSVALWTDGLARYRTADPRPGLLCGTANAVGWLLWGATGPVVRPGVAIPELLGAVAVGAWVVVRVTRDRTRTRGDRERPT